MQLSIKWDSTPTCRHEATFVKSVVGVRVVVDTYRDQEEHPCRTEAGALGPMLKTLLDPAGRYRLAPMLNRTMEALIEDLFDAPVGEHVAERVTEVGPKPELGYTLHPVFQQAMAPFFRSPI